MHVVPQRQDAIKRAVRQTTVDSLARLYASLTTASFARPTNFASDLVQVLRTELDLVAATLYITSAHGPGLRLKAADGFSYSKYQSFELSQKSYPGLAIAKDALFVHDAQPFDPALFRDFGLLEGLEVDGIVVVPIPRPGGEDASGRNHLGCVCLYTRPGQSATEIGAIASAASPLVGQLYVAALEHFLMHFRKTIVGGAAFKNDVGSLVRSFIELSQDLLQYEAAAAWVYDPRRARIFLRGVTGVRVDGPLANYSEGRRDSTLIGESFSSAESIYEAQRPELFADRPEFRNLPHELENGVALPVSVDEDVKLSGEWLGCLGVVVILNHYSEIEGVRHFTEFTWEDEAIFQFANEMLAVLIFQLLRSRDHESDYERQTHGARTNLQCAKQNLQFLQARVGVDQLLPARFVNYIPNAIDWIEDLERQINRGELLVREDLRTSKTPLFGRVLAPVMQLVMRSAQAKKIADFELIGFDLIDSSFRDIPFVRANPAALITVFRNLGENSLKYRSPRRAPRVEVGVTWDADRVRVSWRDNGLGVDPAESEDIFREGYRGNRARAVNTQGMGVGLYDSSRLLELMGGSIRLGQSSVGSEFVVHIPVWKGES